MKQQRLIIIIAILASFVAFLDGSVINVALPAIARDLHAGLTLQQWVVDAYLITLGALMLIGGSLSDLLGRKRILFIGLIGFGVASLLSALAPNGGFLIAARALQGVAGALLVPSSLALIVANISGKAQAKAIGTWNAWISIAFLIGPLLGGGLVDAGSWRLIFAINVVPIAVTLWLMTKTLGMAEEQTGHVDIDWVGAVLGAAGLGGPVYALIEQSHYGWSSPLILAPLIAGLVSLAAFIWYERRAAHPMLPLAIFNSRNFSAGNMATFVIYAALAMATFLIAVFVQEVGGYSATEAGLSLIPVTVIMFLLSPRFGALAGRFGPRIFMTLGPIIGGLGFLLLLRVDQQVHYWSQLLPGILVFGFGLSVTVAPLTAAILGSVDKAWAGIGSAINNAVARVAGLIGISFIGVIVGSKLNVSGFERGMIIMAGLLILGGLISAVGITNAQVKSVESE